MLNTIKPWMIAGTFALFSSIAVHAAPPAQANAAAQASVANPIDLLQAQIDSLFSSVASLEDRVTLTEQSIADLQAQAESLQAQIKANDGDIAYLESQLKATNVMLYKMQKELAQLERVVALKQDIVTGHCPDGQYLKAINPDGSVECAVDVGAGGIAKSTVYRHITLKECFCVFDCDPCPTNGSGTVTASCPAGTTVSGGGFTAGPWIDVSNSRASGNGWAVSGAVAPIYVFTGSELVASATCLSNK